MAIMPFCCKRTRSVVHQDRAILFCACKTNDCCAELSLTAPFAPGNFHWRFYWRRQVKKGIYVQFYNGETHELPSMLEEKSGCSAVITGNTVVVMGGRGR